MAKLEITGGKKLYGRIKIAGNKNSVLPIMAACLLTEETCTIDNVPAISDVSVMSKLLSKCGVKIYKTHDHKLKISAQNFKNRVLPRELTEKLRASILLLGPLLARFGKVELATPGGCQIGARPIDTHLEAFKALGAEVLFDDKSGLYRIVLDGEPSTEVVLREASVTATENLLMLGFKRPLTIKIAATEPHVVCLGSFLENLGASIEGLGRHIIKIKPAPQKLP